MITSSGAQVHFLGSRSHNLFLYIFADAVMRSVHESYAAGVDPMSIG